MASETEICNIALSHLGIGKEISNIDTDASDEASACRRFYDTARDSVLKEIPWPFATKIRTLALIEEEPNDDWNYSYRYPSDCLFIRRFLTNLRNPGQDARVKYKVAQDSAGLIIYTDERTPTIEYTVRETDPVKYPSDFILAFSFMLAFYIVPRLTKGDPFNLRQSTFQAYRLEISRASAHAFNEEELDRVPESEFIRGRE